MLKRVHHRGEMLSHLLQCFSCIGCFLLFYGLMAIPNWPLRHLSRTTATTLLTWFAMGGAMLAVFGRMELRCGKLSQQAAGQIAGVLITDGVTFVQLQIMNVNPNNNAHLTLFGVDFWYLLLAAFLQSLLISLLVRAGARLLPRVEKPAQVLLITAGDGETCRQKLLSQHAFWQIGTVCSWEAPTLNGLLKEHDTIMLAPDVPYTTRMRLMKTCYHLRKTVLVSPKVQEIMLTNARRLIVDDMAFLELRDGSMALWQAAVKRTADVVCSFLALVLLSPLLGVIALAIHFEDGGSVFFRQQRLTLDGRTFTIYKFRTMRMGDEHISAMQDDERITRVGRVLRRWRLDELPQFWNILRGDMSMVGPRPEMLENIRRYKSELPEFEFRERMKAGLTGYAQIEGRYNTSPEDKLMLDLFYIEGFSLWTDVKLLLRTLTVLFRSDATAGFQPPENQQRK